MKTSAPYEHGQSHKTSRFEQLRLFREMPEKDLSALKQIFTFRTYSPKQSIYTPEEAEERVYIIIQGAILVYQYGNAKRIIIDILHEGDMFGDASAFSGYSHTPKNRSKNYAEAKTSAVIGIAQKKDWIKILEEYPLVSLRVINELSRRLNEAEGKIRDLALHDIKSRVIHELIRLSQEHSQATANTYTLQQKVTHEELSQLIGASREAVTRGISQLTAQGILSRNHGKYRIEKEKIRPAELDF